MDINIKEIAEKYHWLQYEQVEAPEEHLWIVLRWYLNQYVVHLYNAHDDGHYHGQYFWDNKEQAELAYKKKLQSYRQIGRPENLMEVLEIIRINGACNMLDIDCICDILNQSRYKVIADYLKNNQNHYEQILEDFKEWKANQPQIISKSLAQQLADEMGWDVIVD